MVMFLMPSVATTTLRVFRQPAEITNASGSDKLKARLAERYATGSEGATPTAEPAEMPPPGQTALFNSWEDAVECARCGGRMVRTGSCYTCRDCGTNTGCS